MKFTARDEQRLVGVHPALVKVFRRVAEVSVIRFTITEGVRSLTRQKVLVAKGLSKTMKSRHLTGHAIDVALYDDDGKITWDLQKYKDFATIVEQVAASHGIEVEAGVRWKTIVDGPHFQLSWKQYP